jgi:hypothetical protein
MVVAYIETRYVNSLVLRLINLPKACCSQQAFVFLLGCQPGNHPVGDVKWQIKIEKS